jgi:hypothetical protein
VQGEIVVISGKATAFAEDGILTCPTILKNNIAGYLT